mmetsp:Transcript_8012/g.36434  ORF Transcript_8012/g.36434 Transcript_8012/m.36434 type:complete len:102 (-) Transcript_8012:1390-1695(-)
MRTLLLYMLPWVAEQVLIILKSFLQTEHLMLALQNSMLLHSLRGLQSKGSSLCAQFIQLFCSGGLIKLCMMLLCKSYLCGLPWIVQVWSARMGLLTPVHTT